MVKLFKAALIILFALLSFFSFTACASESSPIALKTPVLTDYDYIFTGTADISGTEYDLNLKLYEKTGEDNTFTFEYCLSSGGTTNSYNGTYSISNSTIILIDKEGIVMIGVYNVSKITVALHVADISDVEFTLTAA